MCLLPEAGRREGWKSAMAGGRTVGGLARKGLAGGGERGPRREAERDGEGEKVCGSFRWALEQASVASCVRDAERFVDPSFGRSRLFMAKRCGAEARAHIRHPGIRCCAATMEHAA